MHGYCKYAASEKEIHLGCITGAGAVSTRHTRTTHTHTHTRVTRRVADQPITSRHCLVPYPPCLPADVPLLEAKTGRAKPDTYRQVTDTCGTHSKGHPGGARPSAGAFGGPGLVQEVRLRHGGTARACTRPDLDVWGDLKRGVQSTRSGGEPAPLPATRCDIPFKWAHARTHARAPLYQSGGRSARLAM